MKIIDNNGQPLEVTDLKKAIRQARLYAGYKYADPTPEQKKFELRQQRYWSDLLSKLKHLQQNEH